MSKANGYVATLLALVAFFFQACAHSTRVLTVPEGAQVYVNGKALGESPTFFNERSGIWGRKRVFQAKFPDGKVIRKDLTVKFCTSPGNILLDLTLVGLLVGFCVDDEVLIEQK
ncbi:MAG: PEGA domain-containing protein [Bdellovibrionales bacterium]|nr:PEGA domain-containing protein [Bdellovibrionales bacterium]